MQREDDITMPPTMHFIWAGGSTDLPLSGIKNIVSWCIVNPLLNPVLWVDPLTSHEDIHKLTTRYQEQFKKEFIELYKEQNGGQLPDEMDTPNLTVKSIRESGICADRDDIVDYAIDRVDPNFGMSSDILRYRILFKYGGGYVDVTDVRVGKAINNSIFKIGNSPTQDHAIFIDHLSQNQNPSAELLKSFELQKIDAQKMDPSELEVLLGKKAVGNDTFFCTKNNPFMQHLAITAEQNFAFTRKGDSAGALMMAYTAHNSRDMTIEKTGPTMVTRELLDLNSGDLKKSPQPNSSYVKTIKGQPVIIKPVRCDLYQLTQPLKNTRFWNNVGMEMKTINNLEAACDKIIKIIRYEIEQMSIIRLDDHLITIEKIAKRLGKNKDEAKMMLIGKLESASLNLAKIVYAQSVSTNPLAEEFYKKHDLLAKIYINKQPVQDPIKSQAQIGRFINIYRSVTSFDYFNTKMFGEDLLPKIRTTNINQTMKPLEVITIYEMIDRGIDFIKKILDSKGQYPVYDMLKNDTEFRNTAIIPLIAKYGKIFEIFQEAFIQQGIDPQELLALNKKLQTIGGKSVLVDGLRLISIKYGCNEDYRVALHRAVEGNQQQDVKFLVNFLPNVNIADISSGKTALHFASEKGHKEIVEYLLQRGANPELTDRTGKKAIDMTTNSEIRNLLSSTQSNVRTHNY